MMTHLAILPHPLRRALPPLIMAALIGCGQTAPSDKKAADPSAQPDAPASPAETQEVTAASIHGVWAIDVDETVELLEADAERSAEMAKQLRGLLGSMRYMFAADGTARAALMNRAMAGTWRVVQQEGGRLVAELSLEGSDAPGVARITVRGPDALVLTSGDDQRLVLERARVTAPWAQQPPPRLAPAPTPAADPAPTGPAATVNGVAIPRAAVEAKFEAMTQVFRKHASQVPAGLAARYRRWIAKQLIEEELLRQEIAKQNISVDAAALDAAFEDHKKLSGDEEGFQRYLAASNTTVEQVRDNLRHSLAVELLLGQGGALEVTDDAIRQHYDAHQQAYRVKEQVRASHILFKVAPGDAAEVGAKARQRADEIYVLATAPGADFAALAKAHSQGPRAPQGGDLGLFTRGRLASEVERAAFDTAVGEVTRPIKSQLGWHVLKVTDRAPGRQQPLDEVRASIVERLQTQKRAEAKTRLIKRLRSEAQIEVFSPGSASQ